MLAAAQRFAELLDAQVLDAQHNALGRQTVQHIRDELRAFDRKREKSTIKKHW
jgi:cell division protein ZipA